MIYSNKKKKTISSTEKAFKSLFDWTERTYGKLPEKANNTKYYKLFAKLKQEEIDISFLLNYTEREALQQEGTASELLSDYINKNIIISIFCMSSPAFASYPSFSLASSTGKHYICYRNGLTSIKLIAHSGQEIQLNDSHTIMGCFTKDKELPVDLRKWTPAWRAAHGRHRVVSPEGAIYMKGEYIQPSLDTNCRDWRLVNINPSKKQLRKIEKEKTNMNG